METSRGDQLLARIDDLVNSAAHPAVTPPAVNGMLAQRVGSGYELIATTPLSRVPAFFEDLGQDLRYARGSRGSKAELNPFVFDWSGAGDPKVTRRHLLPKLPARPRRLTRPCCSPEPRYPVQDVDHPSQSRRSRGQSRDGRQQRPVRVQGLF
jgi:hypothetical protein